MVKTTEAMGFCNARGRCKIAVHMPHAMFDALKHRAIKEGRSISAQIRDYIEVGLEVDRDFDDDRNHGEGLEPVSLTAETAAAEVTHDDRAGNLVPDPPQAAETGRERLCEVDLTRAPILRELLVTLDAKGGRG